MSSCKWGNADHELELELILALCVVGMRSKRAENWVCIFVCGMGRSHHTNAAEPAPRVFLTGWVASSTNRLSSDPQMTLGRTLKKESSSLKEIPRQIVQVASTCCRSRSVEGYLIGYLWGQIKGTTTHRNEPTKHLDKDTEWKWSLLKNLHSVSPTD